VVDGGAQAESEAFIVIRTSRIIVFGVFGVNINGF
jgi:hypothetical protein